jgi:hypothetical protein
MKWRALLWIAGTVLAAASQLVLIVSPALAGTQRTDPQAGSPAGVIYQIPLDSGRREAAPAVAGAAAGGHGGGGSSGGGTGTPSGTATGGDPTATAAGNDSASSGSGSATHRSSGSQSDSLPGGGTPTDPSSIHSNNGFGSSSYIPGVNAAAVDIGAGVPVGHSAGSTVPIYLLILLIAMAATVVGVIASRATRPDRPGRGGRSDG